MYDEVSNLGSNLGQLKAREERYMAAEKMAAFQGAPQADRPTPMMEIAVRGLVEAVSRMESLVTQAETRFSAVVAIEPPQQDRSNQVTSARRPSSSLAAGIEQIAGQLDSASQRLQSLIHRCEL